jgi:glutathione S-transferase
MIFDRICLVATLQSRNPRALTAPSIRVCTGALSSPPDTIFPGIVRWRMTLFQILGRMTSNNVQKVIWLLDELSLPYAQLDYGGPFGGNHSQDYLARNPHGTVPTMVCQSDVLWESNTILRYIANKYPSSLYPMDTAARGRIEQWMDWQLGTLSPAFRPLYVSLIREGRAIEESSDQHQAAARQFLLLENFIGSRHYIAGASLSLADVAIGPMLYRWFKLGLDQSRMPRLELLLARYASRSAFANAVFRELA